METKKKLPKAFKKKWLAALRSGDYKQASMCLFNSYGYCCLGVAGAICGVPSDKMKGHSYFSSEMGFGIVPPKGLPDLLDDRTPDNVVGALISMNDAGKSFSEIADYIEANL